MLKSTEDGPALICIPDITGFTRFMAINNIEFSRKIIPPLLRNIVNSNNIKMTVGEIEGDAVVFYRFGNLPSLKELVDQCKSFYLNFHELLISLMNEFPVEFLENDTSNRLSLKIIVHAAEMTSTHIEGIPKLIGKDVVLVHKLLKNSIKDTEYILLTDKLLENYSKEEISTHLSWDSLKKGTDEYDYMGTINYNYIKLNESITAEATQAPVTKKAKRQSK
jgi:hypothetical protein